MRLKITLIFTALIIATIAFLGIRVNMLTKANSTLSLNYNTLMSERNSILAEKQRYKTKDSLNAVKITALELSITQYKKYRADDLKLIKSLGIKQSELEKAISAQTETINKLNTKLRDTVVIREKAIDTLKYFDYKSEWTDVSGLIDLSNSNIELNIANREALTVVETVTYKRFLGFLWKTSHIKSRGVNIVSKNPNTEILDVDVISIRQ